MSKLVWMRQSLDRTAWIHNEKSKMMELMSYDSALLQAEISEYSSYLDNVIAKKLSGQFIKALFKAVEKQKNVVKKEIRQLKHQTILKSIEGETVGDKLLVACGEKLSDQGHRKLLTEVRSAYNEWMTLKHRSNSLRRYCQYLYMSNYLYPEVLNHCEEEFFSRPYILADGVFYPQVEAQTRDFFEKTLYKTYAEFKPEILRDQKSLESQADYFEMSARLKKFSTEMDNGDLLKFIISPQHSQVEKMSALNNALSLIRSYKDKAETGISSVEMIGKFLLLERSSRSFNRQITKNCVLLRQSQTTSKRNIDLDVSAYFSIL
ncbi:MAG: hypothetical protein KA715_06040 [Xanthomonadaceae bacterium]|nr:hypothetical protein [Xanthomonadaceae bacterium]